MNDIKYVGNYFVQFRFSEKTLARYKYKVTLDMVVSLNLGIGLSLVGTFSDS